MSSHLWLAGRLPRVLLASCLFLLFSSSALAQPTTLKFQDCFSGDNTTQKLNVSTVYAQLLGDTALNLTVVGQSNIPIIGSANSSSSLGEFSSRLCHDLCIHLVPATLFTSMSTLTFDAWIYSSYFCSPLRPPSPLPSLPTSSNGSQAQNMYCPLPAGPFAFSTTIPWSASHQLTTQNTRLHAVDPFSNDLLCLDVATTPLGPRRYGSPYGRAAIIFWATVGLAIAYWVVVGVTRVISAWGRGTNRPGPGFWPKVESAGFILASAISGERLATSPALMRFCE